MVRVLSRPLKIFVEIVAAIIGIIVILGVLLVWRLSSGPISSSFVKPFVETRVEKLVPGSHAEIANSTIRWDNVDRSITVHADGIRLSAEDGNPIAEIPVLDIRISIIGLAVGRLIPAGLRVEQPKVWLERRPDGTFLFGGVAARKSEGGNGRAALVNLLDDLSHASFMHRMQIGNAVFLVHDDKTDKDWSVTMQDLSLVRTFGGTLTGDAKMELALDDKKAFLVAHYSFSRRSAEHSVTARFSGINPAEIIADKNKLSMINLPLSGELKADFDTQLTLLNGSLNLKGDEGTLNDPNMWNAPATIKGLNAKLTFDRHSGKVHLGPALIDFGGPKLALTLDGAPPADKNSPNDLDFTLALKLTDLPMNDFAKVWPKPIIPGAHRWISASLSKGKFEHGEATLKGTLKWDDLENIAMTDGSGEVTASDATVNYLEGMPPVEGASAKATFDLGQMTVNLSSGAVGDVKLLPSTIKMTDFEKHVQNIDLELKIAGPVPGIMRILDAPHLQYAKAMGLSVDAIAGSFDGLVSIKFPLLNSIKMSDIDIKVGGDLKGVASSKLVEGLDISQGDLKIDVDQAGFGANGTTALNGIPVKLVYKESFEEQPGKPLKTATVSGTITGEQIKKLGIEMLAKTEGSINLSVDLIQKAKQLISLSGTVDMKNAALDIGDIGWKKAVNQPASMQFDVDLPTGKNIEIKSLQLAGDGLSVKGSATLAAGTYSPVAITLDPLVMGRTDATIRLTQAAGSNGKITFTVKGKALDISGLQSNSAPDKPETKPKEFIVDLGKIYTSPTGIITNAKGRALRDADGWSDIDFHGMADGTNKLDINLTPYPDGHRNLLLRCDSFGKALKGLGITDTVQGGTFKISGASTPEQPRAISGKMWMDGFTVKDLPVLAILMNATSPFGIIDLFTGMLSFDHLQGKYRWKNKDIAFEDVRAAGTAVGITVNGKVDLGTSTANLNGTVAPFSMFNRILNYIPVLGDIITGGEGQGVLGVNYTLTGPLDKPQVNVNPISLLTPGFLRNMFFGSDNDSDDVAPEPSPPEPVTPPVKSNINKRN